MRHRLEHSGLQVGVRRCAGSRPLKQWRVPSQLSEMKLPSMTTQSSNDDDHRISPGDIDAGTPGLWEESDPRIDDWEVSRDPSPCAVYGDGPGAMGRVTTPLGDLGFTNLVGGGVPMLRQLGQRSAPHLRDGALDVVQQFTGDVVESLVPGPLVRAGRWAMNNWMGRRFRTAISDDYLRMLQAFGEGCGRDVDEIVDAQMAWDVWALLARSSVERIQRASSRARKHSPLLGSFSMVLPTESVGPLHFRWLDNAAVDRWDRRGSAVFFHPDQGMSYVLVSSSGFVTGLPCGMNSAGLTVSVEPSASDDVHRRGEPVGRAVHEILSQAHVIEEAATILREYRPMTPWRYVVCEGETGRAVVIEAGSSVSISSDFDEPPFALGTFDGKKPVGDVERIERWHKARRRCIEDLIDGWSGRGDDVVYDVLEKIAGPAGESMTAPGDCLGGLSNVGAVVFEPANRRFWIAVGRTPVSRRWFVPMTLRPGDGPRSGGLDGRVRPVKPAGDWENETSGRAIEHLRQARQLALAGEDPERILIILEHAVALQPESSAFHTLTGLVALRAGRARRAEGAMRRAADLIDDAARRAEVRLYLGWSLDAQQRRKEARGLYGDVVKDPATDRDVRRWARAGRRRRFDFDDFDDVDIDFFLATVFDR